MKKTSKIAALFMAAVLTVALATGCSQQSTTNSQSASSETVDNLTIAISADENTLTPFTYVHGSPGFDAMSLIYDTLFVRSPDNTIIPWMVYDDVYVNGKMIRSADCLYHMYDCVQTHLLN